MFSLDDKPKTTDMTGAVMLSKAAQSELAALNPPAFEEACGRPVTRSPEQLRLHHIVEEAGGIGIGEVNKAVALKKELLPEPILITANGTILAGFGRWRLAILQGWAIVQCIEYAINEEESLQFILSHHQTRQEWNSFVRIRMALTLEPYLQRRTLDNMRAGGKRKGLANLPDLSRIDVRREIANAAGVGDRNVANVKTILQLAHPRLIEALQDGTLSINRAARLCKSSKSKQLEQFVLYCEESEINKVVRQSLNRPKEDESLAPGPILQALQRQEAIHPGSVFVRAVRTKRSVILIGRDLLAVRHPETELVPA